MARPAPLPYTPNAMTYSPTLCLILTDGIDGRTHRLHWPDLPIKSRSGGCWRTLKERGAFRSSVRRLGHWGAVGKRGPFQSCSTGFRSCAAGGGELLFDSA